MGDKINTSFGETCASLSPDEKCNIYWARADKLIDSLKQAAAVFIKKSN
jgi:hypothetical protein